MGFKHLLLAATCFATISHAVEVPGGLIRTGEGIAPDQYEFLMSPVYVMSPTGAYLASEVRYQANEDFAAGLSFGAGEVGFNIGANGTWYILPDLEGQPALGVMGGLYFNRLKPSNWFVVKVAPVVSKTVKQDWGTLTPYAGIHFTPSFRLGEPYNELSVKTSLGTAFAIKAMNGLRLWGEFDLGVANSVHEVVVGLSYPFSGI